jgi:hypothetical protein
MCGRMHIFCLCFFAFLLDFGTIQTVWYFYFFFYFIAYDLTLSSPGMTLYGMLLDVIESSKNIEQNILS